jgi:hypothetical protein
VQSDSATEYYTPRGLAPQPHADRTVCQVSHATCDAYAAASQRRHDLRDHGGFV